MIRVLFISADYTSDSPGGAAKSFLNIYNKFKNTNEFEIKHLTYGFRKKALIKFFEFLNFLPYVFNLKFIYELRKFKPHIIITQGIISYPAILVAKISNIPIICILRDTTNICPKYIDIVGYGQACEGLESKKICYNCIDYWRSLRVLVGNKPKEWLSSLDAIISPIVYKLRFFSCILNLKVLNYATKVVIASEIMKKILSLHINPEKLKIINITPIEKRKDITRSLKKNQLLFITSSYGGSHKGLDFILRLKYFKKLRKFNNQY